MGMKKIFYWRKISAWNLKMYKEKFEKLIIFSFWYVEKYAGYNLWTFMIHCFT